MAVSDLLGHTEPVLGMLAFQKLRGSPTGDVTTLGVQEPVSSLRAEIPCAWFTAAHMPVQPQQHGETQLSVLFVE